MHTTTQRPARMELKTTHDAKALLNLAAALDGLDLTSFVIGSAIEKARKVVADHAIISLAQSGQANLAQLLASPPEPTAPMHELMSLPDLAARKV